MFIYRTRHVIVEAIQLTRENAEKVTTWCGGRLYDDKKGLLGIYIFNQPNVVRVNEGEFLVRSSHGEFVAYTKEHFEAIFTRPIPESNF